MSEFNIEVAGGSSVRLPTAGKYCDRDIIVTATGGETTESSLKLRQLVDKTITEISAKDLQGITRIASYAFYRCTNLERVEIPEGVTHIELYAFYSCGITSISLPDSLVDLTTCGLQNCTKLETLTFGENIKSIGPQAIRGCTSLKILILKANTPPTLSSNSLADCTALEEIRVPVGSGDAYRAATYWAAHASIITEVSL